jgi:ATP-dependent Clp protease protease subunit
MLMVHNPATIAIGDSEEMQKAIDMLSEVKESIMNAYEIKSGLSRNKISKLMDAETWMNAKEAKKLGFADEILFADGTEPDESTEGDEPDDGEVEMLFSRKAVTDSLLSKLIPKRKPEIKTQTVKVADLEKRLSLLSH